MSRKRVEAMVLLVLLCRGVGLVHHHAPVSVHGCELKRRRVEGE